MDLKQGDFEYIKYRLEIGELTVDEANVEMVRVKRVDLVTSRLPADVRRAYNAAVKAGKLGHMKKDGHKPEAYFHPTFDYLARQERAQHERQRLVALSGVYARPFEAEMQEFRRAAEG